MTNLTPLVEDAARALCKYDYPFEGWEEQRDPDKHHYRKRADIALLAFHNPDSEALVEVMARAMCVEDGKIPDQPAYVQCPGAIPMGIAWKTYITQARAALTAIATALKETAPTETERSG